MDDIRKQYEEMQKSGALRSAGGIGPGPIGDPLQAKPERKGLGCLTKILIILLVIGGFFFFYPQITPDKIKGDVVDFALVPQKDSTSRLWILTNGSFEYISSVKRPGYHSVGRKCLFCKAWLYEYDPLQGKVIRKIKIPYEDIMINSRIFYSGDVITHVSNAYHEQPPKILSFNVQTGALIEDTAGFAAKHPALASGITGLRFDEEKNILSLDTRDGRSNLTYSLTEKKLYPSYAKYFDKQRKDYKDVEKYLLCSEDGERIRQLLYKVRSLRSELLWHMSMLQDRCGAPMERISSRMKGASATRLSDKIFIRGIIYQQDNDGAVIISLNQADKKADRSMTLIDRAGNVKWTVGQNELFDKMKVDENKNYWSTFDGSSRSIRVARSGNLLVLMQEGVGIMGFDYTTGKKLFTLD
jgi:hypothetical protein